MVRQAFYKEELAYFEDLWTKLLSLGTPTDVLRQKSEQHDFFAPSEIRAAKHKTTTSDRCVFNIVFVSSNSYVVFVDREKKKTWTFDVKNWSSLKPVLPSVHRGLTGLAAEEQRPRFLAQAMGDATSVYDPPEVMAASQNAGVQPDLCSNEVLVLSKPNIIQNVV